MTRFSNHGATMIAVAEAFATAAHEAVGQVRKYTGEPYISHPRAVAEMVASIPGATWRQVVLAWIHDTVEDTRVTLDIVETIFGKEIRDDLFYLTNVEQSAGNRATRHRLNCERLAAAPAHVATVKCVDIYHNVSRIAELDPVFAPKYLAEKAEALKHLMQADKHTWRLTWEQVANQALLAVPVP